MIFRIARHTRNLEQIADFYTQILGLKKLGDFENHSGYDGIFLGKPNQDWHLEFTKSDTEPEHTFDDDDILVFYPEDEIEYNFVIEMIEKNNIKLIEPVNPYWQENGIMIFDPDDYRIIISKQKVK